MEDVGLGERNKSGSKDTGKVRYLVETLEFATVHPMAVTPD